MQFIEYVSSSFNHPIRFDLNIIFYLVPWRSWLTGSSNSPFSALIMEIQVWVSKLISKNFW